MGGARFKLELFFHSLWKAADSSPNQARSKPKLKKFSQAFALGEEWEFGLPHRNKLECRLYHLIGTTETLLTAVALPESLKCLFLPHVKASKISLQMPML